MSQQNAKFKLSDIAKYLFIAVLCIANPAMAGNFSRKKSQSRKFAIAAFCVLYIAMILAGLGLNDYLKSKPLEQRGQRIVGTVIDVKYVGNKHVPHITYNFTPMNGSLTQGKGIYWPTSRQGDHVQITYLPDDPTLNLLTEDLERREAARPLWVILASLFAVITTFLFGASFYYRRFLHHSK